MLEFGKKQLRGAEIEAFKKLWQRGVSLDDIRKVLPRLSKMQDRGVRIRAKLLGMDYWRDGEAPPDKSEVNETLMRELLKQPRKV